MNSFDGIICGTIGMCYRVIAIGRCRFAIRRLRWGNFAQAHDNPKAARISTPCFCMGS
jgi:hypothetical protein